MLVFGTPIKSVSSILVYRFPSPFFCCFCLFFLYAMLIMDYVCVFERLTGLHTFPTLILLETYSLLVLFSFYFTIHWLLFVAHPCVQLGVLCSHDLISVMRFSLGPCTFFISCPCYDPFSFGVTCIVPCSTISRSVPIVVILF